MSVFARSVNTEPSELKITLAAALAAYCTGNFMFDLLCSQLSEKGRRLYGTRAWLLLGDPPTQKQEGTRNSGRRREVSVSFRMEPNMLSL